MKLFLVLVTAIFAGVKALASTECDDSALRRIRDGDTALKFEFIITQATLVQNLQLIERKTAEISRPDSDEKSFVDMAYRTGQVSAYHQLYSEIFARVEKLKPCTE